MTDEYAGISLKVENCLGPVCKCQPFGIQNNFWITLEAWPGWWARIWFRMLFGWRFVPYDGHT